MNTIERVKGWRPSVWIVLASVLLAVVGVLDYLTGYELASSLFYLAPIALITWFGGRLYGVPAAIVGTLVWFLADAKAGGQYSHPAIRFWNAGIRFGLFLTATLLMAALKAALARARQLSRTDYLTGATSAGYFDELLQSEIRRSARYQHPFTLAYLDIDDFKSINDRFGHHAGDEALRTVVRRAVDRLRRTDTVARLGGDEFAILLPETDQQTAPVVISGIRQALLVDSGNGGPHVTCSIGVMTFVAAPGTTDEAVRMVDELMYAVKNGGKDGINYSVYMGDGPGTDWQRPR
jgi:diguanylate cyclase (GGDEF)-like protein